MRSATRWLVPSATLFATVAMLATGISREVPMGVIEGRLIMQENGRPIPNAAVYLNPATGQESADYRRLVTDRDGRFRARVVAGKYQVEFSAKAHETQPQSLDIAEGKTQSLSVSMTPMPPRLSVYAPQRVFLPGETAELEAHGFEPSPTLQVAVHRLDLGKVTAQGQPLYDLLRAVARHSKGSGLQPERFSSSIERRKVPIVARDAEGTYVQTVKIPNLAEGLYYVSVQAGELRQGQYLNVSRIGLVAKSGRGRTSAYVASLDQGKPLSNVRIQVFRGGSQVGEARTAADGQAEFDLPFPAMLLATRDGSQALLDLPGSGNSEDGLRLFGYTERPVYRPGDEVHFKGILRLWTGRAYSVPPPDDFQIELRDPDDVRIYQGAGKSDDFGTIFGSAKLSPEAIPGLYRFVLKSGSWESSILFEVAAYRKPEFTVQVVSEKPYWVLGDRVRMKVRAAYYFGGPVVGAKVKAYVNRNRLSSMSSDPEEGEEYGDYAGGGYGDYVGEFEATTDEKGEAWIEFPAEAPPVPGDFEYEVEASVGDEANQFYSGKGSVRVLQGDVRLSAQPEDYVAAANSQAAIQIQASPLDGGGPSLAGREVEVRYGYEEWTDGASRFIERGVARATLNDDAQATVQIPTGKEGSLTVRARIKDSAGRWVQTESNVWIAGGEFAARDTARIEARLDKRRYAEGDTATLLIQSPAAPGSAWVTVETDRLLLRRVVDLSSGSAEVPIPVTADVFPNATVSVARVQGKQLLETARELYVDLAPKRLTVSVTPDREKAQPGETVRYQIKTRGPDGNPVEADLSLAVVDEAVYAIRRDQTDVLRGFYPRRWSTVTTAYSFAEIYLDGGDKGGEVPIRSDFRDVAAWFPNIRTDANGEASVVVSLPDNLGSWRATAVAATRDTLVGMGSSSLVSSKPLMVRIASPRILVEGDEVEAAITVQGEATGDASLELRAEGLEVRGAPPASIRLDGQPVTHRVMLRAVRAGSATLIATSRAAQASDGVEQTFRIAPRMVEGQRSVSKAVEGTGRLDPPRLPDGAQAYRAELTIAPSLASGMIQSLDSLIGFPYGCVEQTMSRFLPSLLLSQILAEVDFPAKAMVPTMVADGITRLRGMQHPDGGWGWWEYDDSDPFLTAFVLDGLARAAKAGYDIPDGTLARAFSWAESLAASPDLNIALRDRLYLSWVLARLGQRQTARKLMSRADPMQAKEAEFALAALALDSLDEKELSARLLAGLRQAAQGTGAVAFWSSGDSAGYGAEPSAYALLAFSQLAPGDPLASRAVNYLMATRRASGWASTRDTCLALVALSEIVRQQERPQAETTVQVNGTEERLALLAPAATRPCEVGKAVQISVPEGRVYATLTARYRTPAPSKPVSAQGIEVERAYYALRPQRTQDGKLRLLPSGSPVTSAQSGELLRCQIVLRLAQDTEYLLIEDFLPANLRAQEQETPEWQEDWAFWWDRVVLRDDRIAFFKRKLPKGEHRFTYVLRAEGAGKAAALPVQAGNMYAGTDMAMGAISTFEVRR
jgi:uncharacterized protein YfaS (alpha-2-macroglobulin family)